MAGHDRRKDFSRNLTQMIGPENMRSVDFGPQHENKPPRIKGLGLPPPTEFINTNQLIRDQQEVLSQVAKEQSKVSWRARQLIESTSAQVRTASSALAGSSRSLVERSGEQLREMAGRASPFVSRGASTIATGLKRLWRLIHERTQALYEGRAPEALEDERPTLREGVLREGIKTEEIKRVTERTILRTRANAMGKESAPLAEGDHVLTFPLFKAPKGWILAKTTQGDIGYLELKSLTEEP